MIESQHSLLRPTSVSGTEDIPVGPVGNASQISGSSLDQWWSLVHFGGFDWVHRKAVNGLLSSVSGRPERQTYFGHGYCGHILFIETGALFIKSLKYQQGWE